MPRTDEEGSVLAIDTCGEHGSVALFQQGQLREEILLAERTASAALLAAVRRLLEGGGVQLRDLSGVGVVNGPGSFTGLRVGLSVAKGLCQASDVRIAAVSRLAVLAEAGQESNALAALQAGRNEVYVREPEPAGSAREFLMDAEAFARLSVGRTVLYTEESLAPLLAGAHAVRHVMLSARCAYPLVRRSLLSGGADLATLDANYVRDEQAIYTRQRAGA